MGVFQDLVDFLTGIWEEEKQEAQRDAGATAPWLTPEARERVRTAEDPLAQVQDEIAEGNTQDIGDSVIDAFGDAVGNLVDGIERDIIEELRDRDFSDLEDVNEGVDDAEGAAVALLSSFIGTSIVAESVSAGQVDSFAPAVGQAIPALSFDDITGAELEWWMEKGAGPALEAQVGKHARSEFVDFQDAVEYLLRAKTADEGWITGGGIPEDERAVIGSNVPVNPENPLEEWGLRDDQLQILERVALSTPEIEELIESPIQMGVIPSPETMAEVLQLSGAPESVKDLFDRTVRNAPRSADMWEQRTVGDELVSQLDTLVLDGELDAQEAAAFVPDELENARDALADRWALLEAVPAKAPTRSQVESSFTRGLSNMQTFQDRLATVDVAPDRYPDVVDETILGEIDGELQEAFALGFITEGQYGQLMDRVGLDDETQAALFQGGDLGDVAQRRLEERADPAEQPVASIPGIGESRAAGLRAAGIETVGDLADADVQVVADAGQVSDETAEGFIRAAQLRVSGGE